MESYQRKGWIYERAGEYSNAYECFITAMEAVKGNEFYEPSIAYELAWTRLHIDDFKYSLELEVYRDLLLKDDIFGKSLRINEFRYTLTAIVIALHYNRTEEACELLQQAKEIASPSYEGKLKDILARHRATEVLSLTPEVISFLDNLAI